MKFVDLMLDPGLTKNPGAMKDVGHRGRRLSVISNSFTLERGLDKCGYLTLNILQSPMANIFATGRNTADSPSHDLTILALVCDDSGDPKTLKEIPFFKGLLHKSRVQSGFSDSLSLTYIDPLVATYEQDGPEEFHNQNLKAILTKILGNSFRKAKMTPVFKTDPPACVRTSNREMTDYDFIKSVANEYGLRFYYRPSESLHEVVFFQPDYSKKPTQKIDLEQLYNSTLSTDYHSFLDGLVAHDFAGKETSIKANQFPEAGQGFSKRVKSRQQTGVELISHVHYPNASTHDLQLKAKAKFLNHLWANQTLTFGSSAFLELGELFDVQCKEASHALQGAYLLRTIKLTCQDSQLALYYEGVRP